MKKTLFKVGDVVKHKTHSPHLIVILKVKRRWLNWFQSYKVCWYEKGEYCYGNALEHELKLEL